MKLVGLWFGLGLAPAAAPVCAQIPVTITSDVSWPQTSLNWSELHTELRTQIGRTEEVVASVDRLLRLLGDPGAASAKAVGSIPDIMKPAEDAAALETAKHAIDSGRNLFAPGSKAVAVYDPSRRVGGTYEVFGATRQRETARYSHFAVAEALYARYRTSATNAEAVINRELQVQRQALERLKAATTHAEVAVLTAAISASQQRQQAAHAKLVQAKADLESYRAELVVERERKAEADREWAGEVVQQLREKALAGYQAQLGTGSR